MMMGLLKNCGTNPSNITQFAMLYRMVMFIVGNVLS